MITRNNVQDTGQQEHYHIHSVENVLDKAYKNKRNAILDYLSYQLRAIHINVISRHVLIPLRFSLYAAIIAPPKTKKQ